MDPFKGQGLTVFVDAQGKQAMVWTGRTWSGSTGMQRCLDRRLSVLSALAALLAAEVAASAKGCTQVLSASPCYTKLVQQWM